MKLTILGSGTYQPELDRHSSAYLLEVGPITDAKKYFKGEVFLAKDLASFDI